MKPNVIKLLRPDCHSHRSASVYLIFNTVFLRASSLCAVWRPQEKLWILNWKQTECAINAALVIQIRFRFRLKKKKMWRKLRKGFHKLPTKETVNQLFLFPEGKSECMRKFAALFSFVIRTFKIPMSKWNVAYHFHRFDNLWTMRNFGNNITCIQYTHHRTASLE